MGRGDFAMVVSSSSDSESQKIAIVFPGQGSQSPQMLAAYQSHPQVAAAVHESSAAIGEDLAAIIRDEKLLNETENTQPALLAICVGVFRAAQINNAAVFAGHSLGEYAALVCGGAIDFADAIRLVRRRGELMRQSGGAMAAILGDAAAAEKCCETARENGGQIWAVNYNSPQQTVAAGDSDSIAACREWTAAPGIKRVVPLPVGAASHCPLMQKTANIFADDLQKIKWRAPSPPVLHNATLQYAKSAGDICNALAAQLIRPVRWTETVARFAADGIARAYECGPGGVLCGLARRNPGAPPHFSLSSDSDLQTHARAD